MAALSRGLLALALAALLGLGALTLFAPASATPATTNLYGWPLDVTPTALAWRATDVPAWRPGLAPTPIPGGLLLGSAGVPHGMGSPSRDGEALYISDTDLLMAIEPRTGHVRWTQEADSYLVVRELPDGAELLTVDGRTGVALLSAQTGEPSRQLRTTVGEPRHYTSGALSPDGDQLALWGRDAVIELLEMPSGELHRSFGFGHRSATVQLAADAPRMLAVGWGALRLWDTETGQLRFVEHDERWLTGAADAELERAWLVGDDGWIEEIELRQGGARRAWRLPQGPRLTSVVPLGEGRVAVSGELSGVLVIDLEAGEVTHRLGGSGDLSLSADGHTLIASAPGQWAAWSVDTWEPELLGPRHQGYIVALDLEGDRLATVDSDGSALVQRLDGELEHHVFGPLYQVESVALGPEGSPHEDHLLVGGPHGQAALIDLPSGEVLWRFDLGEDPVSVEFSGDGQRVVMVSARHRCATCGRLDIYDAELKLIASHAGASASRITMGAGRLVVSGYQAPVRVFDLETGAPLRSAPAVHHQGHFAAVRADGAVVIAQSTGPGLLYALGQRAPLELKTCGLLDISDDAQLLLAFGCEGELLRIDTATGGVIDRLPRPPETEPFVGYFGAVTAEAVALSDGHRVAVYRLDPPPPAGTTVAGAELTALGQLITGPPPVPEHTQATPTRRLTELGQVRELAVSPDGARLAITPNPTGHVSLLTLDGELLTEVKRETYRPEGLAFAEDGSLLAWEFGGAWRVDAGGQRVGELLPDCKQATPLGALTLCVDSRLSLFRDADEIYQGDLWVRGPSAVSGERVALIDEDIRLLELRGEALVAVRQGPSPIGTPDAVAFAGERLLLAKDGYAVLVSTETLSLEAVLEGQPGGIERVALSSDGARAATGGRLSATVWIDGAPFFQVQTDASEAIALTPDGRTLLTVGRDGALSWWDVPRCARSPAGRPPRNRALSE